MSNSNLQQKVDVLARLVEVNAMLNSTLDLDLLLTKILEAAEELLEANGASILLVDPESQGLYFTAATGVDPDTIEKIPVPIDSSIAGSILQSGAPEIIHDLNADPRHFKKVGELTDVKLRSLMGVPMRIRDRTIGVLEVIHKEVGRFDDAGVETLCILASNAAIAIENARLIEDLHRSNRDLVKAYDTTLDGWARALELRDRETEGHTQRVAEMAVRLGRAMGLDEVVLEHLRRGAILHDMGKMGIPDNILHKEGSLTNEEWQIMRRHPGYAYAMLSTVDFLRPAMDVPYCHHEKWDGSGYPRGLKGEQIPLAARIFSVVDVWDALITDRPYRKGLPADDVCAIIREKSGTHFDPQVVAVFLKVLGCNE